MKTSILYLILLLLITYSAYSQGTDNSLAANSGEVIQQQISLPGITDLQNFQKLNPGAVNQVSIQQMGNGNTARVNQQNSAGLENNQSCSFQSGNLNELNLGQIGAGNLLLGFQLGYVNSNAGTAGNQNYANDFATPGERNKMDISQTGNNNGVMAVQEGFDNTLSAEQTGKNNYLLAYQKGINNSITDYKQENISDQTLYDRIVQVGDNLSLETAVASKSSTGNIFMQTGSNLSLEISSDLLNTAGGIKIDQTGKDMKIVIDQSYFLFPLR